MTEHHPEIIPSQTLVEKLGDPRFSGQEAMRLSAAEEIKQQAAEIAKLRAALQACIEYWRDSEIPCPPALHDQVTDAHVR